MKTVLLSILWAAPIAAWTPGLYAQTALGAPAPASTTGAAASADGAAPPPPPSANTKDLFDQLVTQQSGLREHDARIRELEKQLARMKSALDEAKQAPPPPPAAKPAVELPEWLEKLRDLRVSGYIQSQLENHDDSEDQLRSGGTPMNLNRFVVRRARLQIGRQWDYSSFFLELDGNTVKGPSFGLQRAEASIMIRRGPAPAPALLQLTAGLFLTPFGYELVESPRTRLFFERTQASRAFYPGEPDVGAKISGQLGWLRYDVAFLNGEPLGESSGFALQDPNNHKDVLIHVAADTHPTERISLSAGVSVLNGKGFAKGSDATKATLSWQDKNDNNVVDYRTEVSGNPASSASASYNFDRWMAGADLELGVRALPLGTTRLQGELLLASNMDRALYIANPSITGTPSREVGYNVAVMQEITEYGMVGFRFDLYNPNADFLGYKSGDLVPYSETIRTYSPVVALVLPGRARLAFEYDFIRDHMGITPEGLPTDLRNDTWTLRLQGEL